MAFQPEALTEATLRGFVNRLHKFSTATPPGQATKMAWAQEAVARALGFRDFHAACEALGRRSKAGRGPDGNPIAWRLGDIVKPDGWATNIRGEPDAHGVPSIGMGELRARMLFVGSEGVRQTALRRLAESLAGQPMLVLHGAASLPWMDGMEQMDAWEGRWTERDLDVALARGSANAITDLLVARLPNDNGVGDSVWRGRARAMMACVSAAMVWLRDHHSVALGRNAMINAVRLEYVDGLTHDERIPPSLREAIHAYLVSVPGWSPNGADEVALEQHGYLQMQFLRELGRAAFARKSNAVAGVVEGARGDTDVLDMLNAWIGRERDGVLVLDGLRPASWLYAHVINAAGRLDANGHGCVVGVRCLDDVGEAQLLQRVLSRMDGWFVAKRGLPTGGYDAKVLGRHWWNRQHGEPA